MSFLFILFLFLFLRQLTITHIYLKMILYINKETTLSFNTVYYIIDLVLINEPFYIQLFIHEKQLKKMYLKIMKHYPNTPYNQ